MRIEQAILEGHFMRSRSGRARAASGEVSPHWPVALGALCPTDESPPAVGGMTGKLLRVHAVEAQRLTCKGPAGPGFGGTAARDVQLGGARERRRRPKAQCPSPGAVGQTCQAPAGRTDMPPGRLTVGGHLFLRAAAPRAISSYHRTSRRRCSPARGEQGRLVGLSPSLRAARWVLWSDGQRHWFSIDAELAA